MNELQILKSDITQSRVVESELDTGTPLVAGEVLLKVDKFGFSTNNVTYAAAGDQLGYWQFFPASNNETETWGIIPVWGFADVVASSAEGVDAGERIFGYYPTNSYLKMQSVKVLENRLIDGADHRSKLPPGYNTYRRVDKEADYDALAADTDAPTSIGLTSKRNQEWVAGLELYDATINYDALEEIDASIPTVIVDMSGNSQLLADIYAHLGDSLVHCLNVGLTHWSEGGKDTGIPADRREFFFAPSHIQMRIKEWGHEGFDSKSSQFIYDSCKRSAHWIKVEKLGGVEELADIYADVCAGKLPPEKALVIEL